MTEGQGACQELSLLKLLALASPALPIGAFAHSQGLEQAIAAGWITSEHDALTWMAGLARFGFGRLDLPVFVRLWRAFTQGDLIQSRFWNTWLLAARGASELAEEDRNMGAALARVLDGLGIAGIALPNASLPAEPTSYITMFAFAAATWSIPVRAGALGLALSWAESQCGAAARLGLFGQNATQRILHSLMPHLQESVAAALVLRAEDIGSSALSQTFAATLHETQYTRLFRS